MTEPRLPNGTATGRIARFVRRHTPYIMVLVPCTIGELIGGAVSLIGHRVLIQYLIRRPSQTEPVLFLLGVELVYWIAMIGFLWPVFRVHHQKIRGVSVDPRALLRARTRIYNYPFYIVAVTYVVWLGGLACARFFLHTGIPLGPVAFVGFMSTMLNAILAYYAADTLNRLVIVPEWFDNQEPRVSFKVRARPTLLTRSLDLFLINAVFPVVSICGVILFALLYGSRDPGELERILVTSAVVGLVCLFFALALTLVTSHAVSSPLLAMAKTAGEIASSDFDSRVVVQSDDHIGKMQVALNRMGRDLGRLDTMKTLFGHYVSPEIRDLILDGKVRTDEGERLEAVVLFSDVRSFTTLTETHPPERVVDLLNIHFSRVVKAVTGSRGFVDKFIGDAVMAVFDAEFCEEQHRLLALCAAVEIINGLQETNREIAELGFDPVRIGIGMACGPVIRGNVGSADRRELTVIGDTVNTASRLEAATKTLGRPIVLTAAGFREHCETLRGVSIFTPPPLELKGKTERVNVLALEVES